MATKNSEDKWTVEDVNEDDSLCFSAFLNVSRKWNAMGARKITLTSLDRETVMTAIHQVDCRKQTRNELVLLVQDQFTCTISFGAQKRLPLHLDSKLGGHFPWQLVVQAAAADEI